MMIKSWMNYKMREAIAVADSGPLIALVPIGQEDFFDFHFSRLIFSSLKETNFALPLLIFAFLFSSGEFIISPASVLETGRSAPGEQKSDMPA
jgi:hypothetical protein